ncbi:Bug family tripartite tricarboxylate transporter substrate binding protein [Tropicibacter alexandrii]|uniref:Bug family tripartite tricarboxylate transporter substrate binding protein n=1 Tax=Tropicibacter alexandrii TaxID=2267683 RepID=UPI000EF463F9|nr:tripartite tricarboxylate transporter substrate-binding protein [Tropicibacter alexandrii]
MKFVATRGALAAALLSLSTFGASAQECIAPANPGGGWDFTCRQVGKTMQDLGLIDSTMQVVNLAGGGGGVAFAEVVNKRGDDNDLIVAASTATATRLAQGAYPGNSMDQVRWLATIGADYGVIAVAADSEVTDLTGLLDQIKNDPTSVSIAGGSAVGGWDHLKVLIAANAYGIDDVRSVKYIAFDGGGEAVTQLLAGSVQAFTGDISEAKGFVDSGDIRVLAVLSPERLPGEFAAFPTAREQGVDAIGANWRGFYAPGGMSDEAYNEWVSKIADLYASDAWKETMAANGLAPLDLQGDAFQEFVTNSVAQIQSISKEIGIIK